jgi:polyphosphate kinase
VPGISDRIRVVSIVGRFLEHSRIFYYENGGSPEVYLGSADWMNRNLDRRVETVFPVEDPGARSRLKEILDEYLRDTIKSRVLNADGSYSRVPRRELDQPHNTQEVFLALARTEAE